jgi:competence protein ComEC
MFKLFMVLCPLLALAQDQLIVWNVGQGQWMTEVHADHCMHYDLGGEFDVTSEVLKLCRAKKNILHLSHWDWDHISFANSYSRRVQKACLVERPQGIASPYKSKKISEIPICPHDTDQTGERKFLTDYRTLFSGTGQKLANDSSSVVYSLAAEVLIPGDSTKAMEKSWLWFVSKRTEGLILGHHGSRTSTSAGLLRHLPHLKWAVASARQSRYGHPHRQVRELLQARRIPLLRTQDWGNLHFILKSKPSVTARKLLDNPD